MIQKRSSLDCLILEDDVVEREKGEFCRLMRRYL